MEQKKEDLYRALKSLAEAQMKLHDRKASENEDPVESYTHRQMQMLFKEFSDLPQALLRGYEVLTSES